MASAGMDKTILVWDVYADCTNTGFLTGHKNAIVELHWSTDDTKLYTASTDKSVAVWDVETFTRIKKFRGHSGFVNSCYPARRGPDLIVSGGDDCTTKL